MRADAVALTIEACRWAEALGASEVCVWSAWDGYDYSLQADYDALWARLVDGFRQVCDAAPGIKVSLEFKPTDENTRFFAVPSTRRAESTSGLQEEDASSPTLPKSSKTVFVSTSLVNAGRRAPRYY